MGAISWTHARLLIDVATPESEAAWIAVARDLTVRALARRIRAGAAPVPGDALCPGATPIVQDDGSDVKAATTTSDNEDEGSTIDGEPAVRLRIACPRRLRALWRATVELARRMAGEPLPVWQACEAIAAEALSSPAARWGTTADGRGTSAASIHSAATTDCGRCSQCATELRGRVDAS